MIVLDTSALLYWSFAPGNLTSVAAAAIRESDHVIVNAISLWEVALKVNRGKLALPMTVREYVHLLQEVDRLEIRPTDLNVWLRSFDLDWPHRDPADRVIVAAADLLGCRLISSDQRIRAYYSLTVW